MHYSIRKSGTLLSVCIWLAGICLSQNLFATPISGLGLPSDNPSLAAGTVIDFESDSNGDVAVIFSYPDVTMTGNNVLRITSSFNGSFNVSGNSMALTSNDRTEEIRFDFSSPVDAFGVNLGGLDFEWHLVAYSSSNAILDDLIITPFGSSNDGEWFGISTPGIASAILYNTAYNASNDTGTPDYIVLDNFTYATSVPEPVMLVLMSLGLAGLGIGRYSAT